MMMMSRACWAACGPPRPLGADFPVGIQLAPHAKHGMASCGWCCPVASLAERSAAWRQARTTGRDIALPLPPSLRMRCTSMVPSCCPTRTSRSQCWSQAPSSCRACLILTNTLCSSGLTCWQRGGHWTSWGSSSSSMPLDPLPARNAMEFPSRSTLFLSLWQTSRVALGRMQPGPLVCYRDCLRLEGCCQALAVRPGQCILQAAAEALLLRPLPPLLSVALVMAL